MAARAWPAGRATWHSRRSSRLRLLQPLDLRLEPEQQRAAGVAVDLELAIGLVLADRLGRLVRKHAVRRAGVELQAHEIALDLRDLRLVDGLREGARRGTR